MMQSGSVACGLRGESERFDANYETVRLTVPVGATTV